MKDFLYLASELIHRVRNNNTAADTVFTKRKLW